MLQFGASLTDNTRSVNYDLNTFIIQATGLSHKKTDWAEWLASDEHTSLLRKFLNYRQIKFWPQDIVDEPRGCTIKTLQICNLWTPW